MCFGLQMFLHHWPSALTSGFTTSLSGVEYFGTEQSATILLVPTGKHTSPTRQWKHLSKRLDTTIKNLDNSLYTVIEVASSHSTLWFSLAIRVYQRGLSHLPPFLREIHVATPRSQFQQRNRVSYTMMDHMPLFLWHAPKVQVGCHWNFLAWTESQSNPCYSAVPRSLRISKSTPFNTSHLERYPCIWPCTWCVKHAMWTTIYLRIGSWLPSI